MRKKSLNHDDASIWKKVAETVTPIMRQRFGVGATDDDETISKKAKTALPKPKPVTLEPSLARKPDLKTPLNAISARKNPGLIPADLDTAGYGGISRAGARSIKSGQSGYTSKIDLHGLSREKAQIKLRQFLQRSARDGHRHVLVITGKGAEGKGVIRSYFPVWLNEAPLSDLVIAYCQAQPKDGGSGAWYVNLRS